MVIIRIAMRKRKRSNTYFVFDLKLLLYRQTVLMFAVR